MRGNLTISHIFAAETDFIIAVPKKTTAPLADVICTIDGITLQTRKVYPAPHTTQVSMLIENLEQVWYFVKFYRSADGISLDTELLTLAGNAKSGAAYPIARYEYVVNRGNDNTTPINTGTEVWSDPVEETIELRDERLKDKFYWIQERSTGDFLTDEITDRSDDGGGFDLAIDGKVFEPSGVYIVTVVDKVDMPDSSVIGGGSDYNDIILLTADQDLDPITMYGKLLLANWAASQGTLSIPNFSLLPDGKFKLSTQITIQNYCNLQLDAGNNIKFLNLDRNALHLGKGEIIEIIVKNNVMYVLSDPSYYYKRVGQRIWGDRIELNTIKRDGTQYQQADQPRLMAWINEGSLDVVTETQWASSILIAGETVYPYKGKYAVEGTTVRVPDDRNISIRALKYLDGVTDDVERSVQLSGGYQHDGNRSHGHTGTYKQGKSDDNESGVSPGYLKKPGTGGSNYGDITADVATSGGVESRSKNIGLIPLLCI